jgi:hypothetical protein
VQSKEKKTMRTTVAAALMTALLAGCESLHVYNAARDKQGVEAKEAWSAVDLPGIVTTEQKNLDKLAAAELTTQDRLANAIRDQYLRVVVSDTPISASLVMPVENRRTGLVGSGISTDDLDQVRDNQIALVNFNARVEDDREAVALESGIWTTCDVLNNGKTPKNLQDAFDKKSGADRVLLDGFLAGLRRSCESVEATQTAINAKTAKFAGRIQAAYAQWRNDEAALASAAKQVTEAKKAYADAIAAYQVEVKVIQRAVPSTDRLNKLFGDIRDAAEKLESIQGGLGKVIVAKDRLETTEHALQVLSGKEKADALSDPALREDLAPLLALQHWWGETAALLGKAQQPRTTPFLIEQEHQRLALESAKREVQAGNTTTAFARQVYESLVAQVILLNGIKTDLDALSAYHGRSLPKALQDAPPKDRQQLYSVAGRFLDAVGRVDGQVYRLEYQRLASIHGNALAQSEVSMLMWKNLIGTSIEQLADYHASGLHSESVVQLMQAIGVLWIGSGVNK